MENISLELVGVSRDNMSLVAFLYIYSANDPRLIGVRLDNELPIDSRTYNFTVIITHIVVNMIHNGIR